MEKRCTVHGASTCICSTSFAVLTTTTPAGSVARRHHHAPTVQLTSLLDSYELAFVILLVTRTSFVCRRFVIVGNHGAVLHRHRRRSLLLSSCEVDSNEPQAETESPTTHKQGIDRNSDVRDDVGAPITSTCAAGNRVTGFSLPRLPRFHLGRNLTCFDAFPLGSPCPLPLLFTPLYTPFCSTASRTPS